MNLVQNCEIIPKKKKTFYFCYSFGPMRKSRKIMLQDPKNIICKFIKHIKSHSRINANIIFCANRSNQTGTYSYMVAIVKGNINFIYLVGKAR